MLSLHAAEPEFLDRGRRIRHQSQFVIRVDPRPRYDSCAIHRADIVLIELDEFVQSSLGYNSLTDEQIFEFPRTRCQRFRLRGIAALLKERIRWRVVIVSLDGQEFTP